MTNNTAATETLADYYRAFSTLDVQAIMPYFHEPALLIAPVGVMAVPDSEALEAILTRVIDDLRARDYGHSEFRPQQVQTLSAATVLASGVALRYKTDGQELEQVGITYLLQQTDDGWKIAVMVMHDKNNKQPE